MSKILQRTRKIDVNKICRACLSERGHLREIFSTKLPRMMENCARVQVSERDGLAPHVCVTCFHLIAKFYTFKKKIERSDRILRTYARQAKHITSKDILNIAVNEAQIETDDELPLSERSTTTASVVVSTKRQSRVKAERFIETVLNESSSDETVNLSEPDEAPALAEPPPLVPLELNKTELKDDEPLRVHNLDDPPPLVPLKPTALPLIGSDVLTNVIDNDIAIKLQCSSCDDSFTSVSALKEHKLSTCKESSMKCNICRKEFKDRKRLIGHLKGHMVAKDYGCKICGKRYPNPSTFRVHMRTHTGERPYKCQVCGKGFVRWAGVVGHMRTHQSHKPYKCETCGKGFKISSNLERHKVLHSDSLPYCCNYCGKTFSQSDNLQLHIRTYHTNERPYLCNECGKGFVSSTRLNRHMWVHTGYKPYRCKTCPKAYSNSNDLKNHVRGHHHAGNAIEADKPHACAVCEMRFYHPCRLAKHMKTHDRPYACQICCKTFSSDGLLARHMNSKKSMHYEEADEVEEDVVDPLVVVGPEEVVVEQTGMEQILGLDY